MMREYKISMQQLAMITGINQFEQEEKHPSMEERVGMLRISKRQSRNFFTKDISKPCNFGLALQM